MKKQNIDWGMVEMEFRAGQVSIRAIAQEYSVSEGAIRKRAKRENWQRDLANRVLSRVHDKLERSTQQVRSPNAISEESIIESAASRTMGIIDIHRTAADRARKVIEVLTKRIEDVLAIDKEDVERYTDKSDDSTLVRDISKAMSLNSLTSSAKNIAGALDTLITIERKAYGLDNVEDKAQGQNILIIEDINSHLIAPLQREESFLSDEEP